MRTATTSLGSRLRQMREAKGLRLQDVAEAIESDKGTMSLFERDVRSPSLEHLAALARFYGTTRSALLRGLDGERHPRRVARPAA